MNDAVHLLWIVPAIIILIVLHVLAFPIWIAQWGVARLRGHV